MKSKNLAVDILFFCYAFFSFTVYKPNVKINIYSWLVMLGVNMIVYIFITLILGGNYRLKPLCQFLVLIYILYLISVQSLKMYNYINLYHNRISILSTFVVTAVVILLVAINEKIRIENMYLPISLMIVFLLTLIVILNITKAKRYNLTFASKSIELQQDITLFDYIIPYTIVKSGIDNSTRKKSVLFIIINTIACVSLTLFAFMCVRGNLLYSLSPLQMLFQISCNTFIRNFDALFNFLLYFAYFRAVISLLIAYRTIKTDFIYFGYYDLFMIIPLTLLYMKNSFPILFVELMMILIIFTGKEKKEKK